MSDGLRRLPLAIQLPIFIAGAVLILYGLWSRPMVAADRALREGHLEAALAGYSAAEQRFGRFPFIRWIFAADHNRAAYNNLALLFRAGKLEALLDKAPSSPQGAAPHFWAGTALLSLALKESNRDARLSWLTRAEAELQRALRVAPDDWDAKFNYEIAARVAAAMRLKPPKAPATQMQILRPQPRQSPPPRRTG